MDKNNQLETAPIGKLVFKLAIPTVMAQLVRQRQSRENTRQLYNAAYNIFGSAGGCVYAYEKSDIDEIRRK